jgi:hypothetical protein
MKKNLMKESVMFITGRRQKLKLKGPQKKIKALLEVLIESKRLYEALNNSKITLKEIREIVETKKEKAKKYRQETGKHWPL